MYSANAFHRLQLDDNTIIDKHIDAVPGLQANA
jgi:hypothetical protein